MSEENISPRIYNFRFRLLEGWRISSDLQLQIVRATSSVTAVGISHLPGPAVRQQKTKSAAAETRGIAISKALV
jgi:hypothetical protein